jgi:hypothetical protein
VSDRASLIGSATGRPLVAVTGSQRPYIFDLPHLLSLPKGFEFRFRYRPRWVEEKLVEQVVNQGETFAGREMVILFHSQDSKRLIPVRRGEVIAIESIGPMIFLRFRVGDFPRLNLAIETYSRSAPEAAALATDNLQALARTLIGAVGGVLDYDLGKALPEGYYVREARQAIVADNWSDRSDSAAWARLAAILHEEPNLSGIPLFFVLGFRRETGSSMPPQAIENRFSPTREPIYGFSLIESERYRLRVVEWSEPPKGVDQAPVKVHCEHNADRLALEGASDLVVGRYDVIEFTFSAFASGYSEIALRAEPLTSAGDASPESAELGSDLPKWANWPSIFVARIPVVVRRRPLRFLLALLAGMAGFGLYLFGAPALADERVKALAELIALGLLVVGVKGLDDFLGGIFNLGANLKKLKGGPTAWSSGDR